MMLKGQARNGGGVINLLLLLLEVITTIARKFRLHERPAAEVERILEANVFLVALSVSRSCLDFRLTFVD